MKSVPNGLKAKRRVLKVKLPSSFQAKSKAEIRLLMVKSPSADYTFYLSILKIFIFLLYNHENQKSRKRHIFSTFSRYKA
jgi:hypothetical protein